MSGLGPVVGAVIGGFVAVILVMSILIHLRLKTVKKRNAQARLVQAELNRRQQILEMRATQPLTVIPPDQAEAVVVVAHHEPYEESEVSLEVDERGIPVAHRVDLVNVGEVTGDLVVPPEEEVGSDLSLVGNELDVEEPSRREDGALFVQVHQGEGRKPQRYRRQTSTERYGVAQYYSKQDTT